jgi:hypothetical protein
VDPTPERISLCYYGPSENLNVLLSSGEVTGAEAAALAALLNGAVPGGNPDVPADHCLPAPVLPDALLLVRGAEGVAKVWVGFGGCVDRGVTDGLVEVQVNRRIVAAIMEPLRVSYFVGGDMPE